MTTTIKRSREKLAVLNTSITAKTKKHLKTVAAREGKKVWEVVEEALRANAATQGSPAATDKEARQAQLNCEIDAGLKRTTNILAAANEKRMRYEVEDALISYLQPKIEKQEA